VSVASAALRRHRNNFLALSEGRDVLLCFPFVLGDLGLGGVCKKEPRVRGVGAVYSGWEEMMGTCCWWRIVHKTWGFGVDGVLNSSLLSM